MDWYEERRETERYAAELKQLLAGSGLSPDTRARSLAALIEADAVTRAADKVHTAANTTLGDTMPLLMSTVESFGEKAQNLAWALQEFGAPAENLAAGLRRLPDR